MVSTTRVRFRSDKGRAQQAIGHKHIHNSRQLLSRGHHVGNRLQSSRARHHLLLVSWLDIDIDLIISIILFLLIWAWEEESAAGKRGGSTHAPTHALIREARELAYCIY